MHAQILLFDHFDLLDAVAPLEVFAAAGFEVELVAGDGPREVPSGVGGVPLRAAPFDPERPGIVLVPGVSGPVDDIPALLLGVAEGHGPLLARSLAAPEVLVVTVCGGALVLAFAGLIEGRTAVTHHLGMDVLADQGVTTVNPRVVDDGDLISGGGVTSGLDVALHVVERELGPQSALDVEHFFAHERRGTVWRRTTPADPRATEPSAAKPTAADPRAAEPAAANRHAVESGAAESVGANPRAAVPATATESDPTGVWDLVITTPIGKQTPTLRITRTGAGLAGVADDIPLRDLALTGDHLTWTQSVTRPMRLTLRFAVTIDGDSLSGQARAGRLPSSVVVGTRRKQS